MKRLLSKIFMVGLVLFVTFTNVFSQSGIVEQEERLKQLFEELSKTRTDSVKLNLNLQIESFMETVLEEESAFGYPFHKVRFLGKIASPDQRFRLYTWNLVMEDGSYRYFGYVQLRKGKKEFQVIKLKDRKYSVLQAMTQKLDANNWMGALYYQVQPFKCKREQYYLLLGWDGHNHKTNRKLIEVLQADDEGGILFGAPVISWRGKLLNRVVFEYSKQARMALQYDAPKNRVVFDHLSPSLPRYQGQYEYYGPDFSHDALIFEKGIWKLVENVDARNAEKKK